MGNNVVSEEKADKGLARHFIVSEYKSRPKTPWKMEVKAAFAGKRIRKFCASEAEAWSVGFDMVRKIQSGGTESLAQPVGMTMKAATDAFASRFEAKSKSHRDKAHQIRDLLQEGFVALDVTPEALQRWFAGLPGTETTRSQYYRYTRMFFRWAHLKMRYIERDPSLVLDAPKAAVGRELLKPEQMGALLKLGMDDWLKVCILLAAFAGIRTEELLKMNWDDIDAKSGEIHIRPGVMKDSGGYDQRIVDFTKPITKRKKLFKNKSGKLVPITSRKFHYAREVLATAMGWGKWPDNCLRHSFATYHLAQSKNANATAFQMGHTTPSMVLKVYAVPAKRANADAWWAI